VIKYQKIYKLLFFFSPMSITQPKKARVGEIKQTGIYSYLESLPVTDQKPLVLVHPFFNWNLNDIRNFGGSTPGHKNPAEDDYIRRLKAHLEAYDQPVIVFEEENNLYLTAHVLDSWRGDNPTYFIPTKKDGIEHSDHYTSLEKMIEFLDTFEVDEVDFAGGIYNPRDPTNGCLGQIVTLFENRTSKRANVIEGLYFDH
jgi:hypothetical protein